MERRLVPGAGLVELGMFADVAESTGARVGAFAELEARLNRDVSAYVRAQAAYRSKSDELDLRGDAGVRFRW